MSESLVVEPVLKLNDLFTHVDDPENQSVEFIVNVARKVLDRVSEFIVKNLDADHVCDDAHEDYEPKLDGITDSIIDIGLNGKLSRFNYEEACAIMSCELDRLSDWATANCVPII